MNDRKALIFICSGSKGCNEKRLSHRMARYLETNGLGEIGHTDALNDQLSRHSEDRRMMIFLNDCASACVKLLTNGLRAHEYLYIDVTNERKSATFDLAGFVNTTIRPWLRPENLLTP